MNIPRTKVFFETRPAMFNSKKDNSGPSMVFQRVKNMNYEKNSDVQFQIIVRRSS